MVASLTAYSHDHGFKCIFDTYKERLYSYALAITHSPYIAEEATQEVFVKLWICREALSAVENLDAYIFTIAKNHLLNFLRNASRQQRLIHELQMQMRPVAARADEQLAATEMERLHREAIQLLSVQRRNVYQLSRQQGMNHQEIAMHLHLSPNTVKNHIVSALQSIRTHLARHGVVSLLFLLTTLL